MYRIRKGGHAQNLAKHALVVCTSDVLAGVSWQRMHGLMTEGAYSHTQNHQVTQIPQWKASEGWRPDPSLLMAQRAELAAERGPDDLL